MLSILKNWLAPRANPIGVDFGTDSLKIAQVAKVGGEWQLAAAASADVPSHIRHDPAGRLAFFVQTLRELLVQGGFAGRAAMLALPASAMCVQHLRMPKMDEEGLKKAIPWEARGKLPIDPSQALIRHLVAGEVYQDQEAKSEVIVMAAGRDFVRQLLAAAAKAKLEVVGMNVEPAATVDCFAHVYRRKADAEVTNCFIDLGCSGTRAVISRGSQVLFVRTIPIGGEHLTRAASEAMGIPLEEAKLLRLRTAATPPAESAAPAASAAAPEPPQERFALLDAAMAAAQKADVPAAPPPPPVAAPTEPAAQAAAIDEACRAPLGRLIEELDLCRRYYEATFPSKPVERLIFVGGEARNKGLCQQIAQRLGIAAQVGDPLVRMGRTTQVGIESGIDRRLPQPNWTVAVGLSLGPSHAAQRTSEAA